MTHVTYHAFKQFGQAATIAIVAAAGPGFIGTFVVAVKRYNEEREVFLFLWSMNDMVVGLRLTCLCVCFFSLPHTRHSSSPVPKIGGQPPAGGGGAGATGAADDAEE